MAEGLGLCVGMSLEGVRALLVGWADHPRMAMRTRDHEHFYATWDFTPPEGIGPQLRITFDNDQVLVWGEAPRMQQHPVERQLARVPD